MKQTMVLKHWHPRTNPNGSHGHWRTHQKNHDIDRDMAWASAKQAGWTFVSGKVKLIITLVYPRNTLPDPDNAVARCKGLIDGLVWGADHTGARFGSSRIGWFADDSTEWLDLEVRAIVERGVKEVRVSLEPANG